MKPLIKILAGTKVAAKLIESNTSETERVSKGLFKTAEYVGTLQINLESGNRIIIDEGLVTSPVKQLDQLKPGVYSAKTQNSLYEITLL